MVYNLYILKIKLFIMNEYLDMVLKNVDKDRITIWRDICKD